MGTWVIPKRAGGQRLTFGPMGAGSGLADWTEAATASSTSRSAASTGTIAPTAGVTSGSSANWRHPRRLIMSAARTHACASTISIRYPTPRMSAGARGVGTTPPRPTARAVTSSTHRTRLWVRVAGACVSPVATTPLGNLSASGGGTRVVSPARTRHTASMATSSRPRTRFFATTAAAAAASVVALLRGTTCGAAGLPASTYSLTLTYTQT